MPSTTGTARPQSTHASVAAAVASNDPPHAVQRSRRARSGETASARAIASGGEGNLVLPAPQLEHRQAEETRGVRASLALTREQLLNGSLIEEVGACVAQHLIEEGTPGAGEPGGERDREALLALQIERGRQQASGQEARQDLAL